MKENFKSGRSAVAFAVMVTATAVFAAKPPPLEPTVFAPQQGENAVSVSITPVANRGFSLEVFRADAKTPEVVRVGYPDRGWNAGGVLKDWDEDINWSTYCQRSRAKKPMPHSVSYSNAIVNVSAKGWFGFENSMLPFFSPFAGLYRHKRVVADIGNWLKEYPLYPDHTFNFEFRYDAAFDRLEGYLDGNYAGSAPGKGALAKVVVKADAKAHVNGGGLKADFGTSRRLPAIAHRANPLLKEGAKLELAPKFKDRIAAVMDVWDPALSIDQSMHRPTSPVRSLDSDPQSKRTPWRTGPEFMQWTVPNGFYERATVLCADIPEKGKVPKIGFSMTRFGTSNVGSLSQSFVSLEGAETNADIKVVGRLKYKLDGKPVETPLYLVRVKLNPFKILQYVNDLPVYGKEGKSRLGRVLQDVRDYLDVEFVGAGTWEGNPRSSVQIFGCTLDRMAYSAVMDQSVRGNLFERGTDKPELGIKVTADVDNAAGSVRYVIFDPLFKELKRGETPFTLAKKGETKRLSFDLDQPEVGWYGVDFTFLDAKGRELGVHEASYTVLAADDREAGVESPYACWPLGRGYHNSDPDRRQQAEVMRKAGYRISWQPPATNENEFGFAMTKASLGQGPDGNHFQNPCSRRSAEELEKVLDRAVRHFKGELAKYPSCRYIQLLHEQGGRDVAPCLYDPAKAVRRGEYKGIDGDWDVYYCTEYAKRMRKEFPNLKIFIGNGSVSSEKVADLVRRGFDLSLVDQLGIESKGFSTLPELCCHRESPGCLWALRETGRYFGYTNLTLNACNEYVFRPERRLSRSASPTKIMQVTDYTLRDYLLSLAHGCGIISTGHLEDCNDQYYDTNWGAGGQCTFYPFSYPKRMYTALAVFTRVFDKATLSRVVPTGGNSTYALEFRRDRRVKDFATAFWTPRYATEIKVTYPKGAKVRLVDWQGREAVSSESFELKIGSTPRYCVSDRQVEKIEIVGSVTPDLDGKALKCVCRGTLADLREDKRLAGVLVFRGGYGLPQMPVGTWECRDVKDPEAGEAVEMKLVRTEPAPSPLLWESGGFMLKKPIVIKGGPDAPSFALRVKGNGGFGCVGLVMKQMKDGKPFAGDVMYAKTYVTFDGWTTLTLDNADVRKTSNAGKEYVITAFMFGTGRKALDPIEMADVKGDLRFGGLYLMRNVAVGEKLSEGELRGRDVMRKDVDDKDL